jgi:hypothetical protein
MNTTKHILPILTTILILSGTTLTYLTLATYWQTLYNKDNFNCRHMSYTLAPILHQLGFNTKIIYGNNNHTAHVWLSINGIYFDSTTLMFNTEQQYPNIDFIDSYPWGYWDELKKEKT